MHKKTNVLGIIFACLILLNIIPASAAISVLQGKWQSTDTDDTLTLYFGNEGECIYFFDDKDSTQKRYGSFQIDGQRLTIKLNDDSSEQFVYLYNGQVLKLLNTNTNFAYCMTRCKWEIPEGLIGNWITDDETTVMSINEDGSYSTKNTSTNDPKYEYHTFGVIIADSITLDFVRSDEQADNYLMLYDLAGDVLNIVDTDMNDFIRLQRMKGNESAVK